MDELIRIPDKLFRYRSFKSDVLGFDDVATGKMTAQEMWKHDLFDGNVIPSCPRSFNDPYDCDLCIDSSILLSRESNLAVLNIIKKYCKPEKYDINRIIKSINIIEDAKIVFEHNLVKMKENYAEVMQKALDSVKYEYMNLMRVVCLSEINDSILMWSHYSANHTGYCVEYDFSNDDQVKDALKPINYSDKRVVIDDNAIKEPGWAYQFVLAKSNDWQYEKEWRFVIFLEQEALKGSEKLFFKFKHNIRAVYLGAKASEENVKEVQGFFKNSEVKVYKMYLTNDEYKLKAQLL